MTTNTPPRFAPVPFLAHSAAATIVAAAVIVAGVALMPGRAGAQEPAAAAAAPPTKNLVVPGEVFSVDGHTAFLFTPAEVNPLPAGAPRPWILYGPTLAAYPDEAEKWMHERFTEAGVAVAGIDTGESYGSPAAVRSGWAIAQAGIPVCIIHGDIDVVVPIEPNSARLKARYEALGKGHLVELIVAEGQGHNFWEGFFHCQQLVDFLIQRAREGATGGDAAAAGE